ncbi:DUF6010 family protein [Amycolatopsis rhabdoformis]|uniref:DUF6010 family protein n=1 Tax=Amycolatopsis rhabdoformis TaxID=1448059 RepID=A0ABZ1ICJ6_9PSEU|nr:DUF6010 family protein [Amycolatopsis rhabdoformis]WSE31858.1 DUF6010 family protein [Amycolatopsis rhabdoformis]
MTEVVVPILIGLGYVALSSLIPEPHRRRFNALMVAGAGAAYLSGGALGVGELVFCAVMVVVAFRGLGSWTFIGVGWLLHTAWDVVHHLKGAPVLPFVADSSSGCAVTDPVIALWAFAGGRSPWAWVRRKAPPSRRTAEAWRSVSRCGRGG